MTLGPFNLIKEKHKPGDTVPCFGFYAHRGGPLFEANWLRIICRFRGHKFGELVGDKWTCRTCKGYMKKVIIDPKMLAEVDGKLRADFATCSGLDRGKE